MKNHILHISNSYGGTTVYKNLFTALDKLGIKQTIFAPLNAKNHSRLGNHLIDFEVEGSSIVFSLARKWYHRFLYDSKINIIKKELLRMVDMQEITLIHAHTLCLDGAVAYKISKEFKIPFIASIRNTDINAYYKRLFWKRSLFETILLNAAKIFFISPAYEKRFTEVIISDNTFAKIKDKILIIPNGISDVFRENREKFPNEIHKPIRIIYAGAFQSGKNLDKLILALTTLIEKGVQIEFTAVGRRMANRKKDPNYINNIEKLASRHSWIRLLDSVSQLELIKLFSENDIFAMPSVPETFGLVYVEAMTQGLPLIYAKGQGFDGFYPEGKVGYGVNAENIEDIANKIELIINSYDRFVRNITNLSLEEFNWDAIANKYKAIYFEFNNTDK